MSTSLAGQPQSNLLFKCLCFDPEKSVNLKQVVNVHSISKSAQLIGATLFLHSLKKVLSDKLYLYKVFVLV